MAASLTDDLSALLLKEHSLAHRDSIVGWIGADPARISAAIDILCHHPYREVQRVAWVIGGVAEKHPELVSPYWPVLAERLKRHPLPDAVKRNILRMLAFLPFPERLHGDIIDIAFAYLMSSDEPIAVKSFSMSVLYNLSVFYPGIRNELKELLELELEKMPSPGIKSKAEKILSQLKKRHKV